MTAVYTTEMTEGQIYRLPRLCFMYVYVCLYWFMCVYVCLQIWCVCFSLDFLFAMMFYMFISSDMVKPVDVVNNYMCYRNLAGLDCCL